MTAVSPPAPRFDATEKQVLLFTGVAHLLTHYVELSYPTLAVILAVETGLPLEQVLGWSLAGYLLFGLGALPAGYLADHLGSKRIILIGMALASASTFVCAWAEPGIQLAVGLAGVGLGISTYHPAGMGLISRAVRARGTALGINGIYGNIGIALAPLATSLIAASIGWRWTFAFTGLLLTVATAAGAMFRFDEPVREDVLPEVEGSSPIPPRQIVAFIALCFAAMLAGFSYRANTVTQPALFDERVAMLDFGIAASIAMTVGIVGQYVGGRVADRLPLAWSYLGFHLASIPTLFLMTWTFDLPLLIVASLFVFFSLGMQPIENSLFAQLTPDRWRATAYGLKFTLTFGIGSSAVAMVSWVGAESGLASVYLVLLGVVCMLASAAFIVAVLSRVR